ncbi:unnamed protein product [Gongylonema pulchrum]|uniref:Uncharacterized protein n=1 Tax=Gongylonema pulchrum TaxID=637853 RepID=A0A183E408_9BILA|nr:unnamed protein product [Gongylonema pulchrum]
MRGSPASTHDSEISDITLFVSFRMKLADFQSFIDVYLSEEGGRVQTKGCEKARETESGAIFTGAAKMQ